MSDRIMTQVGAERIRAAMPSVEVIEVPMAGDVAFESSAPVLFGVPLWTPTLETLLRRGVEWLHLASTGVDSLASTPALRGRTVTCARGAAAIPIAEFSLAAMLTAVKELPEHWVRGPVEQHAVASLGELNGQVLGIVGLGGIGTELAARAQAFGMTVRALRRSSLPGPGGVEVVTSLEVLLAGADHVVLAAPATERTYHLLDATAFKMCKPGVHIVNVARGSLIDHEALAEALAGGIVGRATLDVTEPEPLPAGHPLYDDPKVKISQHISWSSPLAFERMTDQFIDNLGRYLRGEPLLGVVDPVEGY
jgi:phosphoglycerate dehydrogenase-like enzyme